MPWLHFRKDDVRPGELVNVIKKEPEDKGLKDIPVAPGAYSRFTTAKPGIPKGIIWGIVGLIVFFVGGSIASYYMVRGQVTRSLAENAGTLRRGVEDLQNLDTQSAARQFSSLQDGISGNFNTIQALGFFFKGGVDAVQSFNTLAVQLTSLSTQLSGAESAIFSFAATGNGVDLITQLSELRKSISVIDDSARRLSGAASFVGGLSSIGANDMYLSVQTKIDGAKKFLDAFIPWLSAPRPHHLLVFLDNPSEIRPGGGFLGSYADLVVASGSVTDVTIHDIADADAAFAKNIIPPKPLQSIVKRWRPADANWFFDFPSSAAKTMEFFNEGIGSVQGSASAGPTYDAAIAVSPQVVSDLLTVTGPIAAGAPAVTFTADNFLVQVQKIVENGQATDATYPKQVLRDLSQALFAEIASTTAAQRQGLAELPFEWVVKRDLMVYFADQNLQNFFDVYGASGAVYALPQKFNGDYLAVVDANVGGGKSDLYVSSTVTYSAQINYDGTLTTHLAVGRRHNGGKSPYWWYKTVNKDYLQVFTPPGTTIADASGGVAGKINPLIRYARSGYATDTLLTSIEGTNEKLFAYPALEDHEESGKQVFMSWLVTKPGKTSTLTLEYGHRLFLPPAEGVTYQFVFEKQAGTARHYDIEINAPLGYVFAENNLAAYSYASDDPPGRLIVPLTLAKLLP